ncbi:ankyrin repeat and zinc finger domain-containing protein 1-like [Daphnia pulex]|uniref:ankyrin repeat and zinc finger domain-containing protein 1-like n=1 Tax=Daphnia pulex TaxID=6669 RepID=UPI001EE012EB|nr:ankyrin repeat and zinc finger domain-containing protein 1-like [Daphnia pulex]
MATCDSVNLGTVPRSEKKKRYIICNQQDVSEIWNGLVLCASKVKDEVFALEEPIKTTDQLLGEELHCRTCLISFTGNDDYRLHYRDDLHRYNLKLKLNGKPPISQDEFCEIEDGISSISGSDSEEDSSEGTLKASVGSPKIYFQNQAAQKMAVYRCLLHSKKKPPNSDTELLQLIQSLPKQNMWAIIMLGGGHFAAAIYQGADLIHHKTFHSYTVRAKQGGGQSSRDNKSGGGSHPKSAGASLRRYNEAAFAEHVQSLFISWCDVLKKCHFILYRAASSNQTIMFGGKNPFFDRSDPRLRSIPFPTRRATLNEVQRVWLHLATVELVDEEVAVEDDLTKVISTTQNLQLGEETSDDELKVLELQRAKRMKKKIVAKINSNIAVQPVEIIVDDKDLFPGEKDIIENIFLTIKRGNADLFDKEIDKLSEILDSYREEYHLDMTDVLNQRLGDDCETLLQRSAMVNKRANFVWKLMELGCDPSLSDASGRVPYMVASDKETRATFRRFMGAYPDRFDFIKAAIPSPLTDEIEKQKADKLAEKRKVQKQAKKEKKSIEKAKMEEEKRVQEELRKVEEEKRKIEEDKARFVALSDREKRALAAERRLLANASVTGLATPVLVRCFLCGLDISGKVPFEYNNNKFCSPPCLQKHRKLNVK